MRKGEDEVSNVLNYFPFLCDDCIESNKGFRMVPGGLVKMCEDCFGKERQESKEREIALGDKFNEAFK